MARSVLIAAPDQTSGYELRAQVEELDGFTIVDVAESTIRLQELVAQRDPEIVLIHEQVGPVPVLQVFREIAARRPGTALLLLSEEFSPEVFSAAMDAGARGVLRYPVSLEDLESRLTSAAEWVTQMRRHLVSDTGDSDLSSRGRLVAVHGAKGGVGTTTLAVHLAHDSVTRVPGRSVCLVDLNLDTGDVADFLGIEHRLDVSDLAKVADDLSVQTVGSAVHRNPSGLATVLSPAQIEDVGAVGDRETVLILAALRRQFDLVVVDCGAAVNPASASAIELADTVLLVTTPDLLALRGVHRTIEKWSRVGSREVDRVQIVLNRVSKDSDIQPEAAARLLPAAPLPATLPDALTVLQRGLNHQDPAEIQSKVWWKRIEELADAVGTVPSTAASAASPARRSLFKRKGEAPATKEPLEEAGQATVEFSGVIFIVLFLMLLIWQIGLWGISAAYTSHASDEAAREAGIGASLSRIEDTALENVPGWFRENMTVRLLDGGGTVQVRSKMPLLLPRVTVNSLVFTSETPVVQEDD
jgi:pilus assembly protein CpaE